LNRSEGPSTKTDKRSDPSRRGALKCLAFGGAGTLFVLSGGVLAPVDLAFAIRPKKVATVVVK
jgi:hypothetical protein